ncbi:MAG: hypothetical protein ABW198_12035 [Pseudorhodoplanes sp.]
MKTTFLVLVGVFVPELAAAHTSIMPHQHPHEVGMLPDLAAMLMAAVAVSAGVIAIGLRKKAAK